MFICKAVPPYIKKMKCLRCGTEINDDAIFCYKCGEKVKVDSQCFYCGAELGKDMLYCPVCGKQRGIQNHCDLTGAISKSSNGISQDITSSKIKNLVNSVTTNINSFEHVYDVLLLALEIIFCFRPIINASVGEVPKTLTGDLTFGQIWQIAKYFDGYDGVWKLYVAAICGYAIVAYNVYLLFLIIKSQYTLSDDSIISGILLIVAGVLLHHTLDYVSFTGNFAFLLIFIVLHFAKKPLFLNSIVKNQS